MKAYWGSGISINYQTKIYKFVVAYSSLRFKSLNKVWVMGAEEVITWKVLIFQNIT
jgi:hypothetical protein